MAEQQSWVFRGTNASECSLDIVSISGLITEPRLSYKDDYMIKEVS